MQGWDSAWRDQFSSGQKKILPVGWVLDANTAAETWEQSGTLPHALLDPQAPRKKGNYSGENRWEVSLLCFSLVVWMASEHHRFPLHAGARVSMPRGGCLCGQQRVCPCAGALRLKQASVIAFPSLGLGHTGISRGKMKGMFEDLCSVCEQGLEERRSKKKIGAELKSMAGRD